MSQQYSCGIGKGADLRLEHAALVFERREEYDDSYATSAGLHNHRGPASKTGSVVYAHGPMEWTEQSIHPRVVAVPTYLLNGQVVSLGNPERHDFLAQLRRLLEEVSR
jgi:hypothetical protein